MLSLRVKIKLLVFTVLVLSTIGLNKASACASQRCVTIHRNGEPVGYGCVTGGSFIECWATVEGCTIIYCGE